MWMVFIGCYKLFATESVLGQILFFIYIIIYV